jgi:hypothetical protein
MPPSEVHLRFQRLVIIILGLMAIAPAAQAAPSIVDFNDVYYEGYPHTGGFVAHNASSLTVTTPSGVTAGDSLYILTTGIATLDPNVVTVGNPGLTNQWFAVRNLNELFSHLGGLYAFTAYIKTTQTTPLSVTITPGSPSNMSAIIFEVTGGSSPPGTSVRPTNVRGPIGVQTGLFVTTSIKPVHADELLVAYAASLQPELIPGTTTLGFTDLNWLGIGGEYPTAGSPAAYAIGGAAEKYSITFNMSSSGSTIAGAFAAE